MASVKKDDILVFTGYTDPSIPEADKLLAVGQKIKVWEIDATGAVAVLPQLEDGTFDEDGGDTVYDGEFQTLAEYEAANSGDAVADAATADAAAAADTAADAPKAKAKGKGKVKAKTETKAKTTAPAEEAPAETTAPATIQPVDHTFSDSESVQSTLAEYDDALEAAQALVERAAENDYTLGGVLAHIRRGGIYQRLGYEGKNGFAEYVEKTLGVMYRKAMYLITIYEHFRALDIPEERLAEIGWSKAKELVNITDREKFDEAHEYAKTHTKLELQEYMKSTVDGGTGGDATGTTSVTKVTRNFRLFEDQATTVDRAIQAAKAQAGTDDDNAALEHICAEWSMMSENSQMTLEDYIQLLNAKFNVDLVCAAPVEDVAGTEEQAVEEHDVVAAE